MSKRDLTLTLALFTLIGFSGIGFLIHNWWSDVPPREMFQDMSMKWWLQIPVGAIIGAIAAFLGWKIISAKFMDPVRGKYGGLISSLNLSLSDIILVSFCAGVGEEILFRGALQPHWGVWLTSFIFVGLHGYLNPMSWRVSIYGIFMTGVIIALGFMKKEWGLVSAMSAHTFIDIVLLIYLSKEDSSNNQYFDDDPFDEYSNHISGEHDDFDDEDDNSFA